MILLPISYIIQPKVDSTSLHILSPILSPIFKLRSVKNIVYIVKQWFAQLYTRSARHNLSVR
jgi:hypothetical protein